MIVVDAIFFVQEASACAFEAAHRKCSLPRVLCKRVPLSTNRVNQCFPCFPTLSFIHHLLVTHRPSVSSISLKSFRVRPRRPILYVRERSACKYLIVRLPGRVLTSAHISTRVNSYTFTAQGSFCRRNVKKLMLMLNQMQLRR